MARDISDGLTILVVVAGQFYSVPVWAAVMSVGRREGADIRLPNRFVSARHAVLRFEEGGATVEDVGSRNGVRVRNVPIEVGQPTRLRPGDVIQIGASALALRSEPWAGDAATAARGRARHGDGRPDVAIDADPLTVTPPRR